MNLNSAGVVGPTGHGVAEQFNAYGRVDIFTGTLGKAFGGAMEDLPPVRKKLLICCASVPVLIYSLIL